MKSRAADYFHPAVLFVYTISLAVMSMLFFNPIFIAIGLVFAAVQNIMLLGARHLLRQLAWSLPLCIAVALFNPLVNSGGKTVLFYLFGNPVTMEATFYGACSGGMLLLIFLWFSVYNALVTPDKFMYLFSGIAPAASMVLVMTQRMIPMFARRLKAISAAQKTLFPASDGNRKSRFKRALREISILLSWSMEDGLDTADSMKARGYGGQKRTSFSIYSFTATDAAAIIAEIVLAIISVVCYYKYTSIRFFPRIRLNFGAGAYIGASAFAILGAALPIIETQFILMWKKIYKIEGGSQT